MKQESGACRLQLRPCVQVNVQMPSGCYQCVSVCVCLCVIVIVLIVHPNKPVAEVTPASNKLVQGGVLRLKGIVVKMGDMLGV